MQRRKQTALSAFVLGLTAIAITGCGAPNTNANSQATAQTDAPSTQTAENSGNQGEATFTYGDSTYIADLKYCSLTEGEDALFHGVAHDEAGNEVGYLDGDFGILDGNLHGEARIDFGATAQFESTDEFISMGDAASQIVATDFSDTSWYIMGGGWNQDGAKQSNVTLKVAC